MRALLDVNVLIALLDANHVHHRLATGWLEKNTAGGWASCPITQNGCIRIMSQPGYPNPVPAAAVAERLGEAAALPFHAFWPDDASLLTPGQIDWSKILGSRQVTDAYLLALAVEHGGRLATFDKGVQLAAVPGAQSINLEVIVK
jgi:toxin-antitoxin system PIN domain toxin